jgi:hypothetical protein
MIITNVDLAKFVSIAKNVSEHEILKEYNEVRTHSR